MIVENMMKKNVITVMPSTSIRQALDLMKTYRIRHLPVIDAESHLVGIISDRDLRSTGQSAFERKDSADVERVESIMSTNIITATPLDFIEDVAVLFHEFKISCMPILQDDKLVGIVTETDLLYTFVQITGANKPSSRFELEFVDRPGVLSEVSAVFQRRSINIISILLYPSKDVKHKTMVIRAEVMNTDTLVDELTKEGFDVLWPKKI